MAGQGLVRVRARDERSRVVLEGRSAGRCCRLQVGELLDLAEQLVEDGTLDELAKVLPLDSAFVDAQFAAECRLKGFKPKQDGNFT